MSDKTISDDQLALQRIAAGGKAGERALEQLYRTYRPKMLGFLRTRRLDLSEAEDVIQQVFLVVAKKAHTFRGDCAVSSWLFRIARNEMINLFRVKGDEINLDDDGWEGVNNTEPVGFVCPYLPDPQKALQECFDKAYMAFERAHPVAADLIYRTLQNEDWDTHDIAHYLGRNYGAAREFLSQCKKKLKQFMEPCRHLLEVQS